MDLHQHQQNQVMPNVLILCTGNSCRSQMAHGFLAQVLAGKAQVFSAGVETHGLNPGAVATMAEAGINIGHHTSNHLSDYLHLPMAHIITVCDHAAERCPIFPGPAQRHHHNFSDPSKLQGSPEEKRQAFRQTREEIRLWCEAFAKAYFG